MLFPVHVLKRKEELIVGTWNATSIRINGVESIGGFFEHFIFIFNDNNTGQVKVKPQGESEDTSNITYTINEDDNQLILTYSDNYVETYSIVELSNDKMELNATLDDGSIEFNGKFDKQ